MSVPVLVVLVMVTEAMLHYFRWREVLQGHKLPRLIAYALGVSGMMIPFTWWLMLNIASKNEIVCTLWIVIVSAGLAVVLCYGIDQVVDLVWKVNISSKSEQVLKEAIHATSKGQD